MQKKKLAILTIVLMTLFFAFAIVFVVFEANHDCSGEDCPICEQIEICQKAFEEFGVCVFASLISFAICFGVCNFLKRTNFRLIKNNLINSKIEMLT